jgi:hypothetical protein
MHTSAKIAAWFATAALPFTLYAVDLPNTFSNGTVADADAVNANFSALSEPSTPSRRTRPRRRPPSPSTPR